MNLWKGEGQDKEWHNEVLEWAGTWEVNPCFRLKDVEDVR